MKKLPVIARFLPHRPSVAIASHADAPRAIHQSSSRPRLTCRWITDRATGRLICVWSANEAESEWDYSWHLPRAA